MLELYRVAAPDVSHRLEREIYLKSAEYAKCSVCGVVNLESVDIPRIELRHGLSGDVRFGCGSILIRSSLRSVVADAFDKEIVISQLSESISLMKITTLLHTVLLSSDDERCPKCGAGHYILSDIKEFENPSIFEITSIVRTNVSFGSGDFLYPSVICTKDAKRKLRKISRDFAFPPGNMFNLRKGYNAQVSPAKSE